MVACAKKIHNAHDDNIPVIGKVSIRNTKDYNLIQVLNEKQNVICEG